MPSPSLHPARQGLVTTDTSEPNPAAWYDARAAVLADLYERVAPERLHGWLDGLLPTTRSLVLDMGAGSGRDAA